MLQDSLKQVFDDPEFKEAIVQTGAPWEFINYGGVEECEDYVAGITEIGNEFKPLLTGDTDEG